MEIIDMLLRERSLAPIGILPWPAPLPNLRDAFASRAAIFGPAKADAAPAAALSPWHAIGAAARRIVEMLTPGSRS